MQRLINFFKSERGNVLAMSAAVMPMLLASAGFGVDTFQLAVLKRQLQRAADSSAMAGAYAVSQASTGTANATLQQETTFANNAVTNDLLKNRSQRLAGSKNVVTGPSLGFERTVRVELAATPRLPFMAIFTKAPTRVTATATAALVENGSFCMLSLYEGNGAGIDVSGNATLDLGCGIATNAGGTNGVSATGSSVVKASPIMSRGGLLSSTHYAPGTTLQPYSAEQKDPYAAVQDPPPQSGCTAKIVKAGDDEELKPGCFSSLEIKGTARLAAGAYYINGGDLTFTSQAQVSGTGVTFILTGPNNTAGNLNMHGGAALDIHAPTNPANPYNNILFYRDRRAPTNEIHINGGSAATMSGALYFPNSNVVFNGNTGFNAKCFKLIGLVLKFNGKATISNKTSDQCGGGLDPGFRLQFVRLVR
jgi:Flp pilus assembly protein TadG